jgi:hypothetical protein
MSGWQDDKFKSGWQDDKFVSGGIVVALRHWGVDGLTTVEAVVSREG